MTGKAETGEIFAIANSPNRFSRPDLLETSVGDLPLVETRCRANLRFAEANLVRRYL
jgi:hypothetical protein